MLPGEFKLIKLLDEECTPAKEDNDSLSRKPLVSITQPEMLLPPRFEANPASGRAALKIRLSLVTEGSMYEMYIRQN